MEVKDAEITVILSQIDNIRLVAMDEIPKY